MVTWQTFQDPKLARNRKYPNVSFESPKLLSMVIQFFLTFFKTFMDFMLLYVETFSLGKVTEAILSWLDFPVLEEVGLGLIVMRTLNCLKHLSCHKR